MVIAVVTFACKTPAPDTRLKHDVGELTSHGAFDYYEMPDEEYARTVRGPLLSQGHALVQYSQKIVDQFDAIARLHWPEQMLNVPRPIVAVRKTSDVGAFTADYRRVCYEVPIQISEGVVDSSQNRLEAIEPKPGRLSPGKFISCERIPVTANKYVEFAEWYNSRFAPCRLTLKNKEARDDGRRLVMTGPCREQDFFPRKSSAEGIVVKTAPNRILIFSGMFSLFQSQDQLAAVIAHELAHYYRAHVAEVRSYDYCYRVTPVNHGHRPSPDPSLDDLCGKLRPRIGFSVDEAVSRRLGVYTIEQEADEIAVELLAVAGIPVNAAVDAWFALAADMQKDRNDSVSIKECLELRAKGWKDDSGRDVFIPAGDYKSSHHSWCHRIHNIDKEIAAHNFPEKERQFSVTNWSLILKTVADLE